MHRLVRKLLLVPRSGNWPIVRRFQLRPPALRFSSCSRRQRASCSIDPFRNLRVFLPRSRRQPYGTTPLERSTTLEICSLVPKTVMCLPQCGSVSSRTRVKTTSSDADVAIFSLLGAVTVFGRKNRFIGKNVFFPTPPPFFRVQPVTLLANRLWDSIAAVTLYFFNL